MGTNESPFKPLPSAAASAEPASDLHALLARPRAMAALAPAPGQGVVSTARFHGFDLQDRPLLAALRQAPGELVPARTVVALRRAMIGATVLVLFEEGDSSRPIIAGVLQDVTEAQAPEPSQTTEPAPSFDVVADQQRITLTAEREIVLRCGDASIMLTRAGKVIIKGNYIVSRSTGYNRIKGAAVDIN